MKQLILILLTATSLMAQSVGGVSAGGGASAMDDLTDVTATTATTDDILKNNGTAWINVNLLTAIAEDLANSGCILYESSGGIGCATGFTFDGTSMTIGSASANFLTAEGATADAFETTLAVTDPTADRTWTFPDATDTVVGLATAQTFATGTKTVTSKFDFGGGTLEAPNGTSTPGTCTVGEVYFDSDATAGSNWYGCTATNTWTLLGGSTSTSGPTARSVWEDDFPCINAEDGEWGSLGWAVIGAPFSGGECNYQTRIDPGWMKLTPGAANAEGGIALGRNSGLTAQTFGQSVISTIEADTSFVAYFAFNSQDITEVQLQVGLANDQGAEVLDHTDTARDFIGAYFKNETVDTSSECFGTTGSGSNWNALVQDSGTTSGLQDLTEAGSTSNTGMTWVRIDVPSANQVRVCVDVATGEPTYANCYTETTAARIPDTGLAPVFVVMTCDGTSSSNDGRMDVAYFYADTKRW